MLAQLLGSASPAVRLRVRSVAVTYSVCFCGVGIDSFLGFEYGDVITLASRVFQVLLPILPTSLRFLRIFGFVGVTWWDNPTFLAYPHFFLTCSPFIEFLGFFGVRQGYSCVGVDRQDNYSADSSASLAQCGFVGGFFPNFAIFALVLDHLKDFCFSSWASLLVLPFLLRLPILLSLSPTVTSLGGFSCRPPSLVVPVFVFGGLFRQNTYLQNKKHMLTCQGGDWLL